MQNKKGNVAIIAVIIAIVAITAGVIGWMFAKKSQIPTQKTQAPVTSSKQSEKQPIGNDTVDNNFQKGQDVYFGSSIDGKYSFVNVANQSRKDLIPSGYEIIDQHHYENNPQFLILKKASQLYSLSVQTGDLQKIEGGTLKSSEEVILYPSLSEQGRFYFVINTMKEEPEGSMYAALPVSSRKYFFNATSNKLEDANNISLPDISTFSGCLAYDSKYTRFFTWRCGEGIGNAIPLNVYTLTDKKQREIIGMTDFGKDAESISLEQGNGNFLAMSKSKDGFSKIIVATPTENITKETFTVTEKVRTQLNETYPYSNIFIKNKQTIAVGGGSFMLLLRFNDKNEIVENKYLPEPEIYANFIFTDGQKIYYKSKNQIKILNLDNWSVEKTIPYEEGTEEVNIFIFPKQ